MKKTLQILQYLFRFFFLGVDWSASLLTLSLVHVPLGLFCWAWPAANLPNFMLKSKIAVPVVASPLKLSQVHAFKPPFKLTL